MAGFVVLIGATTWMLRRHRVGWSLDELVGRLPPMPYWPPDSVEQSMRRHEPNMAGQAPRGGYETRSRHCIGGGST